MQMNQKGIPVEMLDNKKRENLSMKILVHYLTDIVDQKMAFHTCKQKSRKWTTIAFANMIDTAQVNLCFE